MTTATSESHLTATLLSDYPIPDEVRWGIAEAGFVFATPIQAKTLPIALAGRDVAGQAQTGTGKTAAFLITIFARLLQNKGLDWAYYGARGGELGYGWVAVDQINSAGGIGGRKIELSVKDDKSGTENVFSAVGALADKFRHQRLAKPRRRTPTRP